MRRKQVVFSIVDAKDKFVDTSDVVGVDTAIVVDVEFFVVGRVDVQQIIVYLGDCVGAKNVIFIVIVFPSVDLC